MNQNEMAHMDSGLGELRDRVAKVEEGLAENTASTRRVENNTAELVDMFNSFKGAFKVLEMLGKAAKPMAAIASFCIAIGAMWGSFRGWFK